jgi:branched-chain amino acid transport system ATP-binding protein
VITGRVKPSTGKIFFNEIEITGWSADRVATNGIARTFQNIKLYGELSVKENVMVAGHSAIRYSVFEAITGLGRYSRDEKLIKGRADELLEIMGLYEQRNDRADSLPYGSQRKLEVARALALNPKLLLLDEPVAGMNPNETIQFGELLETIRKKLDLTVILIDHDMGFVMDACSMIKVIDHGVPIAWGSPREIQSNTKVITAYLGENQ